jgi:hypothetical protein
VFVAPALASPETGNGVSRSPSPTKKHKQPMTPIKTIERTRQDLVVRSVLIIKFDNKTKVP